MSLSGADGRTRAPNPAAQDPNSPKREKRKVEKDKRSNAQVQKEMRDELNRRTSLDNPPRSGRRSHLRDPDVLTYRVLSNP